MKNTRKKQKSSDNINAHKIEKSLLYIILTISVAALVFTFYTIIKPLDSKQMPTTIPKNIPKRTMMGFTSFDAQMAKEFMDKNNDGKCDICGMRIEDCIKSGMMQCTMDPNAKIGLLSSAHIHADFKMYTNGNAIDFAKQEYYMKSMFMHLDNQPNKENAGGVLHMHATGVPLWLFFKSINFEMPNSVKLYVNGQLESEGFNYVFKDSDKLLLTDTKDAETVQQQLTSITNYAKYK